MEITGWVGGMNEEAQGEGAGVERDGGWIWSWGGRGWEEKTVVRVWESGSESEGGEGVGWDAGVGFYRADWDVVDRGEVKGSR